MTKRTEPATSAEIAYWNFHSASLADEQIWSIHKQCSKLLWAAVRNGDLVTENYYRVKADTYIDELCRRED